MNIPKSAIVTLLGAALVLPLCVLQGCGGNGASAGASAPTLQTDPAPAGITPSPQYTVQLSQSGAAASSFVYQVQNPGFLSNGQPSGISSSSTLEQSTAWTSFSFSGSVTVQVSNSSPFTSARILPSHAQITPAISGNTVSFTLSQPGQFAVDFCTTGTTCTEANDTDLSNPMLVFANPIETSVPDPAAANVLSVAPGLSVPSGASLPQLGAAQDTLYFGPGVYDLGLTPLTIGSSQTVYLAGGAYLKGFLAFATAASNAAIRGRGILSGENLPKAQCIRTAAGCPNMVTAKGSTQNLLVEGISFIQSPYYNVQISGGGSGNSIDNVKVIDWLGNGDGLQASTGVQDSGSVIENSFVKNGDDSIKLTASNLLVKNCVVWKLNNAAAFEMGAADFGNLSNITVQDSDVIRAEYNWPNTSDAVFSANQGGPGNLGNYNFNDIRIENASWQLFKIEVLPSNFGGANTQLGSISNLNFNNIQATDAQQFAPVFRGFDPAHAVSNVTFSNVVIGGVATPSPVTTFDANRNMSYAGNTVGDLLFRSQQDPTNFVIPLFTLPTPTTVPQYTLLPIAQPNLPASFVMQGSGDFLGDGYASAVATDTSTGQVGIWNEPYRNGAMPWAAQYSAIYTLLGSDGTVAGTGDFNGDGYSDILLWNSATQTGKILLMHGDTVVGQPTFQPATASSWSVAAVADFNGDGYSDVLLRDAGGNLEFVYFNAATTPTTADFPESGLFYSSTAQYTAAYGSIKGHLDSSWNVAGAGIVQTLGPEYASLVWVNPTSGEVAMTSFTPFQKSPMSSQVFARLPADTVIEAMGDFNADGAKDLLLLNTSTSQNTIWFTNFDGGARYQVGPTLQTSLPSGFQLVSN